MAWQTCCRCSTNMFIPDELEDSARKSPDIWFYCAYGHKQHYSEGESEATKLRRERDRLAQRIAEKDDQIADERRRREEAERRESAQKGQVTKLKNRIGRGVCPCCNRSFTDLRRHMDTKHPDFTPGRPALKVVA